MVTFTPGMRVVVKDGPWPKPRIAGHYGKVVEVADIPTAGSVKVAITGHIDRGEPMPIVREVGLIDWFHPEELDVVD